MSNKRPYPIIEYARKIGKNTAEFTATDFVKFMKWWMKQPVRRDLTMGLKITKNGFEKFQDKKHGSETMRYTQHPVDQEMADEGEIEGLVEEAQEEQSNATEVVCELGLTKNDVRALEWALAEVLEKYDFHEWSETGEALQGIKDALEAYSSEAEEE